MSTSDQTSHALRSGKRKSSHIIHTYKTGDCVEITHRRVAIIKYIGKLKDVRGIWYGIEFIDGSVGSHNGSYKGIFYFKGTDKRCEFIQKGDIRRKLKSKSNSTRNIHSIQSSNNNLMNMLPVQPQLPLNQIVEEKQNRDVPMNITLKLRCMCFADPIPLELKVNINQQTMRHLKKQIITQCDTNTNLPLFKTIIENKLYSSSVDLYQLTMNKSSSSQNKGVRINNLNVKPGNMAYCILKKQPQLFTKLTLNNNDENTDNVPLKYFKSIKDGVSLFVLFKFEVNVNIIFQKTLFAKKIDNYSGFEEKTDNDDEDGVKLKRTSSDSNKYHHQYTFKASISDKFDKLYLKIMEATGLENINSIKLLSNNFIYNKSMMIEKFVYNEMNDSQDDNGLYLYFIHLHQRNTNHVGHHVSRSRNYSLLSNYSTYSTFSHHQLSTRDIAGGNNNSNNISGSGFSMHHSGGHSGLQMSGLHSSQSSRGSMSNSRRYTKVLLNFVSAKKSESYTILDENITIKQLRNAICYKYKIECDRIKLNNDILNDNKFIKDYKIQMNDILHIFDESNITIKISQSALSGVDSKNKLFEIKINKKLSIKHIKFEISKILRYPMMSQTLIMKEILKDNEEIDKCGIKNGDTIRLVYNFGKRVKKLPNQKIKIPIITFNTNKKFEIIVSKNIFIYEIMQIIQREKGIDINKQQLLFHGIILDREQRLNYYNITHEMHLYINK